MLGLCGPVGSAPVLHGSKEVGCSSPYFGEHRVDLAGRVLCGHLAGGLTHESQRPSSVSGFGVNSVLCSFPRWGLILKATASKHEEGCVWTLSLTNNSTNESPRD
jgi:hypothetical protein